MVAGRCEFLLGDSGSLWMVVGTCKVFLVAGGHSWMVTVGGLMMVTDGCGFEILLDGVGLQ